jgi:hypothetical protein
MGRARAGAAKAGITLDALLRQALEQGCTFRVPSGVLGQAWRDGRVQVTLARFLRSEEVEIIPLDEQLARACGELCGATNTTDIIDASVAIVASGRRDPVITSDPHDLWRLDPSALIIPIYYLNFVRAYCRRPEADSWREPPFPFTSRRWREGDLSPVSAIHPSRPKSAATRSMGEWDFR